MEKTLLELIKQYGTYAFHAGVHFGSGEDVREYNSFTKKQDSTLAIIIKWLQQDDTPDLKSHAPGCTSTVSFRSHDGMRCTGCNILLGG